MRRKIANMQVSNKKKRQLRRKINIQVNYYRSQASTTRKAQQAPKQMSALDRLKAIQTNFKRTWNGIKVEYCGRPGKLLYLTHQGIIH